MNAFTKHRAVSEDAKRGDNLVGIASARAGVRARAAHRIGVLCGAILLAGCGARTSLVDEVEDTSCPAAPSAPFSRRLGKGIITSFAVDPAGYPVIAGALYGPLDLGDRTLAAPSSSKVGGELFVARLAPPGCGLLARTFPSTLPSGIRVAVDAESVTVVTASFQSPSDGGSASSGEAPWGSSARVAGFGLGGEHRFTKELRADQITVARPAYDAQGNVFLAGTFSGELTADGAPLAFSTQCDGGKFLLDGFLVKLDRRGDLVWKQILRLNTEDTFPVTVAAWPDGGVAVSGISTGLGWCKLPDLGGGPIVSDGQQGFVTTFDSSGQHQWQRLVAPFLLDSAVDAVGALQLLGYWTPPGNYSIERFDGSSSNLTEAALEGPDASASLAVGTGDDLVFGGATGGGGFFATRFDSTGNVLGNLTLDPPEGSFERYALPAIGGAGTLFLAGAFTGTIDLGTGPLVAELAPNGDVTKNMFIAALPR